MSSTSDHIPFVRLVDLAEGRLAPAEQWQARAHAAECSGCAAEIAWLERVIGLMRTDDAEAPPSHVLARAKRLFQPLVGADQPCPRRRVVATLQFDSARMPLAIGMRSGAYTERQMLFTAAEYDIDLRIAPAGAMWTVSGQILGPDDDQASGQAINCAVELHGPTSTVQATPNDLSKFGLPPVPSGRYTIILRLGDLNIEIDELEIGA